VNIKTHLAKKTVASYCSWAGIQFDSLSRVMPIDNVLPDVVLALSLSVFSEMQGCNIRAMKESKCNVTVYRPNIVSIDPAGVGNPLSGFNASTENQQMSSAQGAAERGTVQETTKWW
jgi:hypothetical protein